MADCLSRLQEELELLGDYRLSLFIDEYDNFANNLLVREGQQKYHDLTHGGGLFRQFFIWFASDLVCHAHGKCLNFIY